MAIPERGGQRRFGLFLFGLALVTVAGCTPEPAAVETSPPATWSVTAWGKLYEVFPDAEVLAAGQLSIAHTHVTVLGDFAPLNQGTVEIVLRGKGNAGDEEIFTATEPTRPGIFAVELRPRAVGDFDLVFRIRSAHGDEEIRGGRVRVGAADKPGGAIVVPAPRGSTVGGEPLPFLKEEQWQTGFATAWAKKGSLRRAVEGLARVRPAGGGEVVLTAPVDGVLRRAPWPFPGLRLSRGMPVINLMPRVATEQSLSALSAAASGLAAELTTARTRLSRLEELLALEATSRREVEEARTRAEILGQRKQAADLDLAAASSARGQGSAGSAQSAPKTLTLKAPFDGRVAAVTASPGAAVAVGDPLVRLVSVDPLWLEVAATTQAARQISAEGLAGVVLSFSDSTSLRPDDEHVRLVAVAPEVDAATGMVRVLVELSGSADLVLGTVVQTQLLLAETVPGVVVPATAVVDDSGIAVVYLQLSGESFARQPVRIAARQGDLVLLDGLLPGQRVVTRGGESIRRSSLMSGSGGAHGHVH